MARYYLVVDTDTETFGTLDDVAMSVDMRLSLVLGEFSWASPVTTAYDDIDDLFADYTGEQGCFDPGPPGPDG